MMKSFALKIAIFTFAISVVTAVLNEEQTTVLLSTYKIMAPCILSNNDKSANEAEFTKLLGVYPGLRKGPGKFDFNMINALTNAIVTVGKLVKPENDMDQEVFCAIFDPTNTNVVMPEMRKSSGIRNLSTFTLFQTFMFALINHEAPELGEVSIMDFTRHVLRQFGYRAVTVDSIFEEVPSYKRGSIKYQRFVQWGTNFKHLVHPITMVGVNGAPKPTEEDIDPESTEEDTESESTEEDTEPEPTEEHIKPEPNSSSENEAPEKSSDVGETSDRDVPTIPVLVNPRHLVGSPSQSKSTENKKKSSLFRKCLPCFG